MEHSTAIREDMRTNRGAFKLVLLNLITFGIYDLVFFTKLRNDLNRLAFPYDQQKTMHYCLIALLFGPISFGVCRVVWTHRLCRRMGCELARRGIAYRFGAGTYWGWHIFGAITLAGPFIYLHKLCKAMNLLCLDYNARG